MDFYLYAFQIRKTLSCGFPSEQWEVKIPVTPVFGIKLEEDDPMLHEKHWPTLIAVRCNTWLLSLSSLFGCKYGFDKDDRFLLYIYIYIIFLLFRLLHT